MDFDFFVILFGLIVLFGVVWGLDCVLLYCCCKVWLDVVGVEYCDLMLVDWVCLLFLVVFVVLLLCLFVVELFCILFGLMMLMLDVGDFILVNKFVYGLWLLVFNNKFLDIGEFKCGDVVVFCFFGYLCCDVDGYFKCIGGVEDGIMLVNGVDYVCLMLFILVLSQNWIKCVIGLFGDIIEVCDSQIVINGKLVVFDELGFYIGNLQCVEDVELLYYGVMVWNEYLLGENGKIVNYLVVCMFLCMLINMIFNQLVFFKVLQGCYLVMGDDCENSIDSCWWGCLLEKNFVGKVFLIWFSWQGLYIGGVVWKCIGMLIY